ATMGSLGWTVAQEGRYDRGREVGAGGIRNRPPCPRAGASGHADKHERHSCNLSREGRYREAEKLARDVVGIQRRSLGPEHPDTLASLDTLYNVLVGEGRYAEAEKSWQQLREVQRGVFGPEDVQTAVSTYNLACVVAREGKRDEAFSLLREAIDHGLPPSLGLGIENDSDLQSLHGDPRFDAVVAHAKERAGAAAVTERERDGNLGKSHSERTWVVLLRLLVTLLGTLNLLRDCQKLLFLFGSHRLVERTGLLPQGVHQGIKDGLRRLRTVAQHAFYALAINGELANLTHSGHIKITACAPWLPWPPPGPSARSRERIIEAPGCHPVDDKLFNMSGATSQRSRLR